MCDLIEKLFLDIKPDKINIQLDEEDVVRHKLVKAIIRAYEKERENGSCR